MNKLTGHSPRHPGLWQDNPLYRQTQNNSISTLASSTLGRQELKNISHQLAQLSQQGRWIVLVNPPNIGYKQLLTKAGVRMDRILMVHAKDDIEALWAMEKAITGGTSSAVITWTAPLDARDNRRLQIVAKNAVAKGIIIETPCNNKSFNNLHLTTEHAIKSVSFNAMH